MTKILTWEKDTKELLRITNIAFDDLCKSLNKNDESAMTLRTGKTHIINKTVSTDSYEVMPYASKYHRKHRSSKGRVLSWDKWIDIPWVKFDGTQFIYTGDN